MPPHAQPFSRWSFRGCSRHAAPRALDGASRMEYERQRAETKERLAVPAFESNRREGQALSFDRSVDLALQAEPALQDR